MAKYTQADCRLCRREGTKLFLKGERCLSKKCAMEKRPVVPGQHGMARKKFSEYGKQLREKQMHAYYVEAERQSGITGETMLSLIERRLDNVVYRMGIGASRAEARQIVNHGHICVNGRRVNIPSYQVKAGDTISIKDNKRQIELFKKLKEVKVVMPKWLEFDASKLEGKVLDLPKRDDIDLAIEEHMIVELYSR